MIIILLGKAGGGGGGLISLLIFGLIIWGLVRVFTWVAENWGIVSFVLGGVAIVFIIIRSIRNFSDLRANTNDHGVSFSILWWLGTLVLISLLFLQKGTPQYSPHEMEFGLAVVFCILGVIPGAIKGWEFSDSGNDAGKNALIGAVGFIILTIFLLVTTVTGREFFVMTFYDVLQDLFYGSLILGILGLLIGLLIIGIAVVVAGAIIGVILSAICAIIDRFASRGCDRGGALLGSLLGLIGGGGIGSLFGTLVNGMLASPIGTIGAAMLVFACSFGFYNFFSPNNETSCGKGRVIYMVLIWLAALSVGLLPVVSANFS